MKLTIDTRGDVHIRLDRTSLDWVGATAVGTLITLSFIAYALQP